MKITTQLDRHNSAPNNFAGLRDNVMTPPFYGPGNGRIGTQQVRAQQTVDLGAFSRVRRLCAPPSIAYLRVKRAFDFVFASSALLISLPIVVLAALFIALESPGSPLFIQRRIGAAGVPFYIFKLRTMFVGTEETSCVTRCEDPRITRIGFWLRATNIDELPQLINIIRGEMSIIGPRPLSEAECNFIHSDNVAYSHPGFIPLRAPGLVGLEQLSRRQTLSYEARFALNSIYEQNISFLFDLKIIFQSFIQCRSLVYCVALACVCELALALAFGHDCTLLFVIKNSL